MQIAFSYLLGLVKSHAVSFMVMVKILKKAICQITGFAEKII